MVTKTAQRVLDSQTRIAHLLDQLDESRVKIEQSRELLAESSVSMARADAMLEQLRGWLEKPTDGRPAVATAGPQSYGERLRVAQDIVACLRAAGVSCEIFSGVQPMQSL